MLEGLSSSGAEVTSVVNVGSGLARGFSLQKRTLIRNDNYCNDNTHKGNVSNLEYCLSFSCVQNPVSCRSHSRHLYKFETKFRRLLNHSRQFCFRDHSYFVEGKSKGHALIQYTIVFPNRDGLSDIDFEFWCRMSLFIQLVIMNKVCFVLF